MNILNHILLSNFDSLNFANKYGNLIFLLSITILPILSIFIAVTIQLLFLRFAILFPPIKNLLRNIINKTMKW